MSGARKIKKQNGPFKLSAVEAEAKGLAFEFEVEAKGDDGVQVHEFVMPPLGKLHWKLLKKIGKGDAEAIETALKAGLGDQWDEFDEVSDELSIDDINDLFDAWSEHSGFDAGE